MALFLALTTKAVATGQGPQLAEDSTWPLGMPNQLGADLTSQRSTNMYLRLLDVSHRVRSSRLQVW